MGSSARSSPSVSPDTAAPPGGATSVQRAALVRLAQRAHACRRCAQVAAGSAVLGERNGPLPAPLLFIAEAPGYRGAVRSGVPLWGDRAGRNFRSYCAGAGLDLERAFITNAVLCHPADLADRNRRPTAGEIRTCNEFLAALLALVDPLLVVALGRVALDAAALLAPHGLRFGRDLALPAPWAGRRLISLYHPSGQTLARRSRAQQRADYRVVARWLARHGPPRARSVA